jgi:hypothetical protein
LIACGLIWLGPGAVVAAPIALQNVPDFSQIEQPAWTNFCTPTSGTNIPYYFAPAYPGLLAGQVMPPPSGPGTPADVGASKNIAGLAPGIPPFFPVANSMGGLMGTSPITGTTLAGARSGLDSYLEINDGIPGANWWNTEILLANALQPGGLGGAKFWNALQQNLAGGAGILLAIQWTKDPSGNPIIPGSEYDIPNPYDPDDTSEEAAMGHSVTMVGYDVGVIPNAILFHDPANNPLIPGGFTRSHVWPVVVADSSGVTVNANDITIMIGPVGFAVPAIVYGAVVTNPVPEPCALVMLGMGLAALALLKLRRH